MTDKKMYTWMCHQFSSGCVAGDDYLLFQKEMRADLNKQLKAVGLKLHKFNKGHYYFSAVVTDGQRFVYVSVCDVRGANERLFSRVLYRTMRHETDWTGGQNCYCEWNSVGACCAALLGGNAPWF